MCSKGKSFRRRIVKSFLTDDYLGTVYDSLLGNALTNKNLVVLENHCIIMRRDHKTMQGKVKIIGGGGAGIEPAEAYYVGKGMLTAAVMGGVFSAPSANEILIAIRELAVDHPDGILLLVKNYVGDKLNFGLAMDKAQSEDITVKMLVIGDDISEQCRKYGRKGMAGSVLVYKIAGELAEQGKTLEEIIEECRENVLVDLATVGLTLSPCGRITCDSLSHFLGPEEMVFGVSIYGKGGTKKISMTNLKDVVSLMLEEIVSFFKSSSDLLETDITVLVNNLGATSKLEEGVVANEVSQQLNEMGFNVALLFTGTFMSSFCTQGFSISILKMNSAETIKLLNAPTSAPAWPRTDNSDFSELDVLDLPITVKPGCPHAELNYAKFKDASFGPDLSEKATAAVKQITIFAAEALISCEKQLNIINSETGDGDAGTVLKRAADALKNAVVNYQMTLKTPGRFLYELSEICCEHMGGAPGALYSVFFKGAAKPFQNSAEITTELCCAAFAEAVKAMKQYGKAEIGDRTMLDVLSPAAESFESAIKNGKDLTQAVYLAVITAEFKAEETKCLKSSSLQCPNIQQPFLYPDAGAHAATIWLRAVSEGLRLHYPSECLSFEGDAPSHWPGIFLWKFLTEEESDYVLENEVSPKEIASFFEKKIGSDQTLLATLLLETVKYCRNKFNKEPKRTSALVSTVYFTHRYFIASKWRTPAEVYFFFRESILRQSVESPPTSTEIFDPEEAKDALIFFFEVYVRNLPLISILHTYHYKLRLELKQDALSYNEQQSFVKEKKKK